MAKNPETLYQQIKSELKEREDVDLVGEVVDFRKEEYLIEQIRFFVAPKPSIDFDENELKSFMYSLRKPGRSTMMSGPNWGIYTPAQGIEIPIFHFGILVQSEKLRNKEDLLDLSAHTDNRMRMIPPISEFFSTREIIIYTYPSQDFANQIYVYQHDLALGIEPNSVMDKLTYSITSEQIKLANQLSLRQLPSPPEPHTYKYRFGTN